MKTIETKQIQERLQKLCSVSEKCTDDIRKKLIEYKIDPATITKIIENLQAEGFIDDERFARAFARTKHKIAKWGKQKIEFNLRIKQIPQSIITLAIAEISEESNIEIINTELQKKIKQIKAKTKTELAAKLLQFAISRGYEYSISYDIIKKLMDSLLYIKD